MPEHAAPTGDPHSDLHQHAASDGEQHEPVEAGDGSWQEELAKVNKALTKRINDLRTDSDTFQKKVSTSVAAFQGDITSLKTATSNNKAAIDAQDTLIEQAGAKADAAKKTGEQAAAKAGEVDGKVGALKTAYDGHTHDLTVTVNGETTPPKAGGPQ